jgi:hypothetical protein
LSGLAFYTIFRYSIVSAPQKTSLKSTDTALHGDVNNSFIPYLFSAARSVLVVLESSPNFMTSGVLEIAQKVAFMYLLQVM